jgi:hypothetical protein
VLANGRGNCTSMSRFQEGHSLRDLPPSSSGTLGPSPSLLGLSLCIHEMELQTPA